MEQLPKILEAKDKEWRKLDFQIVYAGQHPDNPDCAVYMTKDISGVIRYTGYPTVYLVHDNKYDEVMAVDALKILAKINEENRKNLYADFIDKMKKIIAKADPDEIKMYSLDVHNRLGYVLMNLYEKVFYLEMPAGAVSPYDSDNYHLIIFGDSTTHLDGKKDKFKELLDLIEPYKKQAEHVVVDNELFERLLFH